MLYQFLDFSTLFKLHNKNPNHALLSHTIYTIISEFSLLFPKLSTCLQNFMIFNTLSFFGHTILAIISRFFSFFIQNSTRIYKFHIIKHPYNFWNIIYTIKTQREDSPIKEFAPSLLIFALSLPNLIWCLQNIDHFWLFPVRIGKW